MTLPLLDTLPVPAEPPRCRRCHRVCRNGTTAGYGPECAAIVGLVVAGHSRAVAGSGPNLLDLINEGESMTNPDDLIRLTVNLTRTSANTLAETAERLGDSGSDTVNRAIQLYARMTMLEVGQTLTYKVHDGESVTIARVEPS